jgi:hypothetical protein
MWPHPNRGFIDPGFPSEILTVGGARRYAISADKFRRESSAPGDRKLDFRGTDCRRVMAGSQGGRGRRCEALCLAFLFGA